MNSFTILIALDEIPEEFTENFKKTIYLFHHSHPHAQKFLDKYHSEKQVKPKNPKFYIDPPSHTGWLGFAQSLIPGHSFCNDRNVDLLDLNS